MGLAGGGAGGLCQVAWSHPPLILPVCSAGGCWPCRPGLALYAPGFPSIWHRKPERCGVSQWLRDRAGWRSQQGHTVAQWGHTVAVPELYVIFWDSTSTVLRPLSRAPWRIPGALEQKTDTRGQRLSSLSCTSMVLTASMTSEVERRGSKHRSVRAAGQEPALTFRRSGREGAEGW